MDNKISEKILTKIKQDQIKPTAKWKYTSRDVLIWITISLTIVLAGLVTLLLIFTLKNIDWNLYELLSYSRLRFLLITLPHVWIVLLIAFLMTSLLAYKKTRKGYRHSMLGIMGAVLIALFIVGLLAYYFGWDRKLHHAFEDKVPVYRKMAPGPERQWSHPRMGLLGGKIVKVESAQTFKLEDFHGRVWLVIMPEEQNPRAVTVKIIPGEKVKIIGRPVKNHVFQARLVRAWGWRPNRYEMKIFIQKKKNFNESNEN
ncbi:MAG: hypothetical protein GF332_03090 [Candidatus Moranbacteria bacterium]|nr:hypothetical protein [Candidatus Moranbacteria bacterium]